MEAGAIDLQPMALRVAQAHPVDPYVEGQQTFDAGDLRGLALARERPARERGDLTLAPPRLQQAESTGEGGEDQEDERQARPSEHAEGPPNGPRSPRLGRRQRQYACPMLT